jgi:hypothetical protein
MTRVGERYEILEVLEIHRSAPTRMDFDRCSLFY